MRYLAERFENLKKVGTHNGSFHADETMSTAILRLLFEDLEVVRTREEEVLAQCDLVYDVGGGEFDHHQDEKKCRVNKEGVDTVVYSSAGLIWSEFGRALICKLSDIELTEQQIDKIWGMVDRRIIWGIDAMDNGLYETDNEIRPFDVSAVVDLLNPTWDKYTPANIQAAFDKSVELFILILETRIMSDISRFKAYNAVKECFEKRENTQLLVLDSFYPYESALREFDKEKEVLFVCFPSGDGNWMLKALKKGAATYENVLDLPAEWGALKGQELGDLIGIDDAVFCHKALFLASAVSKESILKMAEIALQNQPKVDAQG